MSHDDDRLLGANPTTGAIEQNNVFYHRLVSDDLKQVAGFGEVNLHLTDQLTLTAGTRYFDYTRAVGGSVPLGFILLSSATAPFSSSSTSESGWVSKVNLSYQFNRSTLFYFEAAQGFRPGGVNQVIGIPLSPYQPDTLWDYEVGTKTSWFSNRLVFDVDGYLIDWSDMQASALVPNTGFKFITNAGAAQVKGIEADVTAVPIPGLQIQANISYLNAALTEDQGASAAALGGGVRGDHIPFVPDLTAGVSAQYTWPLVDDIDGMARIDESYVSSSNALFNTAVPENQVIPARALTNIRMGVEGTDHKWGLYFYVNNLLNRVNLLYATPTGDFPGDAVGVSLPPRTFGLNLRKSF
jgi:outer membrane receptor protein involved in Fe transport